MTVVESRWVPTRRPAVPNLHRLVAVAFRPGEVRPGTELVRRIAGVPRVDLLVLTDGPAADGHDEHEGHDERGGHGSGLGLRGAVANLGLPVDVHRLALSAPLRPGDVPDVVAAVSELVGFDPEPGVGCVVPDPPGDVLGGALDLLTAAYRLPLLGYLPENHGPEN